ncbi:TPA: hypothetical protein EYP44_03315 [Candidatus Bathyarchaeota archaeon]|nr:hypothetical protein [Candidatus Bathyarchaeota archaeon]
MGDVLAKDSVMGALRAAREQAKRTSFTQSIELVITLKGIDPKKVEERVRMSVELPHGIPKRGRVCVFARGDLASRALEAGADRVIGKDELDSIAFHHD